MITSFKFIYMTWHININFKKINGLRKKKNNFQFNIVVIEFIKLITSIIELKINIIIYYIIFTK